MAEYGLHIYIIQRMYTQAQFEKWHLQTGLKRNQIASRQYAWTTISALVSQAHLLGLTRLAGA